jgi:hypothetical protein
VNKIIVSLVIFVFAFIPLSFAEMSIKAEVDKTRLTTDETLTYKITVTSSKENLPGLQIPKFEGFNVLSTTQSSTMEFVGNSIKAALIYTFVLAPADIGKLKIAASTIKINKQVYSTDTFEIEVTQGKIEPKAPPEEKPSLPGEPLPESEEAQITL